MDAQRALLDELMGTARNLTEEEKKGHKEIQWDDKEVCAFYMVRFCPHELFVNTRSDIGPCPRIHDPKLKESFENSPRHDSYVPCFEAELSHFCEKLVMDLDQKVRHGRERIAQEPPAPPISGDNAEKLSVLEEKINVLLEQMESLGEAGKVDEAEALLLKVGILNIEKTTLIQQCYALATMAQRNRMASCEICGLFLIANDTTGRAQFHLTGKQHIGYGMMRDFISEFKEAKEKAREEERLAREREAEERRKKRERENEFKSRRGDFSDRDNHRNGNRVRRRDWAGGREYERKRGDYVNGRDGGRTKHYGRYARHERDRSRSRSPIRHSSRRRPEGSVCSK